MSDDLIHDVDLVHESGLMDKIDGSGYELCCSACGTRWPCEVRRLRDALETMQTELSKFVKALGEERVYSAHLKDELRRAWEWRDINLVSENRRLQAVVDARDDELLKTNAHANQMVTLRDRAEAALDRAVSVISGIRQLHDAFVDYHRNRSDPISLGVMHAMRDFGYVLEEPDARD